ncbi:MAG: lipid-A-disaccharide synthase N-terminal domain-containing protein [Planctomycetes bacterium]|nr:lipid-A-disaccharide synthase N-terminal domain-containing protein [Planctomycetota bacterium]
MTTNQSHLCGDNSCWESLVEALRDAILQIKRDPYWEATAFVGEAVFGGRFILQWIVSEYKKKSHVPVAFRYMSIIGSIILAAYSIHIEKPVLIAAFTLQIGIYARNLVLIKKHRKAQHSPEQNEP